MKQVKSKPQVWFLPLELEEKHLSQTQALPMSLNPSFDKHEKSGAGRMAA